MDTILISSCNRFICHIEFLNAQYGKWKVIETGRVFKVKSYALANAHKYLQRQMKEHPKKVKRRRTKPAKVITTHQPKRRRTKPVVKRNYWKQVHEYDVKF
jgi:hypothetical protein